MNYLAIDTGGTQLKYAVINDNAEILERRSMATPKECFEEWLICIKSIVSDYSQLYGFEGLALSCPGAVNNDSGIIEGASALPYIHGPNIRKHVEELIGLKVAMENDANCAALAEVWKGVAKDSKDVVFVVIGTGIGGAIIKNKKLHTGANLHGGEFGYMIVTDAQFEGRQAIWSEVASTSSLIRRASSKCKDLLTGEEVFTRAEEQGDKHCQQAIDNWLLAVSRGLYNLQYIYDPDMIVIGGGISSRKNLKQKLDESVSKIIKNVEIAKVIPRIEMCTYSNDANLIGAVKNYKDTFNCGSF